jgi:hypothetical protein
MSSKGLVYLVTALLAVILVAGACSTGYFIGQYSPSDFAGGGLPSLFNPSASRSSVEAGTPEDLEALFAPFWESWEIIHNQYIDQPVDSEALMRGAIKGHVRNPGRPAFVLYGSGSVQAGQYPFGTRI